MKMPRVYACEDSLEGILSAIHMAYMSRYGHDYQSIHAGDYVEPTLFTEIIYVETDVGKAARVADAVIRKISGEAWYMIRHAAMACDGDKADVIYHFLVRGFKVGKVVVEQLADEYVLRLLKLYRAVQREKQLMYGFVRFQELESGVLFAKLDPKHRQLPLIADHFSDRYPGENWMIYDEKRHEVCVHEAGKGWWMSPDVTPDERVVRELSESQRAFEQWWKTFYDTIGIQERKNPKCRMNLMPKMYWKNMPEVYDVGASGGNS